MTNNELLNVAGSATEQAAYVLREAFPTDAVIESAKAKDIKTMADRKAEELIRRLLGETGFQF